MFLAFLTYVVIVGLVWIVRYIIDMCVYIYLYIYMAPKITNLTKIHQYDINNHYLDVYSRYRDYGNMTDILAIYISIQCAIFFRGLGQF